MKPLTTVFNCPEGRDAKLSGTPPKVSRAPLGQLQNIVMASFLREAPAAQRGARTSDLHYSHKENRQHSYKFFSPSKHATLVNFRPSIVHTKPLFQGVSSVIASQIASEFFQGKPYIHINDRKRLQNKAFESVPNFTHPCCCVRKPLFFPSSGKTRLAPEIRHSDYTKKP
jgi:hypothetical protein